MKDRTNNYFTVSKKATRVLRERGASPFVRDLYKELCELEDKLCPREGDGWFFFNYTSEPGNPGPGKKGRVVPLDAWSGQSERGLRNGLDVLAGYGLIELGYHHPINPKTGRKSKKKNRAVRIVD